MSMSSITRYRVHEVGSLNISQNKLFAKQEANDRIDMSLVLQNHLLKLDDVCM